MRASCHRRPSWTALRAFGQALSRTLTAVLLVVSLAAHGTLCRADDRRDAFPDVVVMHDGSYLRGSLVEVAQGEYVVLLTRSGQMRRFDAPDFTYAGPAEGMPSMGAPAAAPAAEREGPPAPPVRDAHAGQASVHFAARVPLDVYRRSGVNTTLSGAATGESYALLCGTPCTVTLEPGTYTLGVAPTARAPLRAGTLVLTHDATVHLDYRSRRGVRVGGFVLIVGANAAGLAAMLAGIDDDGQLGAGFWGGAFLSTVSFVAGLLMSMTPDQASVRAAP